MTQAVQAAPAGHYRVRHVARSEMAKVLTLRSTAITLGLTVVACLLVTGLVTHAQLHHLTPGYYNGFDPTQQSLTGMITVALAGGVFGALLITGEYSSGTIRNTLAATPKRPVLLATKMSVTAALMVVFCELLSFVSFFLGNAILSGGAPSATLASPGAARAVVLTGLFIALLALMSFGFGLVFRHTAAAIAAFAGVVFVLPLVMHGISQRDVRYLPTNILTNSVMATVHQGPGGPFGPVSPVVGLLLMVLYTAIALAVGAVLFVRRDA
jgi:ABC-type transport system involved in multi-copper enzyme maturation permease subunit